MLGVPRKPRIFLLTGESLILVVCIGKAKYQAAYGLKGEAP